jgi:DNA/RNA-binding domain of Phe-tRNA-synthetase-like protein
LGSDELSPITPGEFGYVDAANRVLCRLDILQAEFSKVTEASANALLIVEGTTAHSPQVVRKAFNDVIQLVTDYCGGAGEIISCPE